MYSWDMDVFQGVDVLIHVVPANIGSVDPCQQQLRVLAHNNQ